MEDGVREQYWERVWGAWQRGATEVHFEPDGSRIRVRERVDGDCRDLPELPRKLLTHLVSFYKKRAGLDAGEHRKPQSGWLRVRTDAADGGEVDMRVSTLPGVDGGERVCVAFLPPRRTGPPGPDFAPGVMTRWRGLIARTEGLILHVGPARSGRTAALHAAARTLAAAGRLVLTAEEPGASRLPGVGQAEADPPRGVTLAALVRQMRRQRPDAVILGRLEAGECVDQTIELVRSGVLVLAATGAGDVALALEELRSCADSPFAVADVLAGVCEHRSARGLCDCARPDVPTAEERARLAERGVPAPAELRRPAGCEPCGGTGYRGRIGVHGLSVPDAAALRAWARAQDPGARRVALAATLSPSRLATALEGVAAGRIALDDAWEAGEE